MNAKDRELLTALLEHDASGWIPEIHLDDCEDDACTGCDPRHLAEKAAAKTSARDELLMLDASGEWPAHVDRILSRHRTEVLAKAADRMAELLKDTPEYGPWVADQIRRMAADGGESRG